MEFTIKTAFANTFTMYHQAAIAHWNVEGMFFHQFHGYFGELYAEIYASIDTFAEEIRSAGFYTPHNMDEQYKYKTISEMQEVVTDPLDLVNAMLSQNTGVLDSLNKLFEEAILAKQEGLADFVAGRIDAHKKHEWMLKSFLRG